MAPCNRKSVLLSGDTPSSEGMLTRYKLVVEEQAFPKSSASSGLSETFLASDNDNIINKYWVNM